MKELFPETRRHGPSPLTVDLSGVGFGQKPAYSVCGDGKRDSRLHFEGVDADDVSVLSETRRRSQEVQR